MSSMVGQKAPDFSLPTSDGEEFNFSDLDGSWKVVFFYAKAGSPTCKRGCLSFKQQYDLFRSLEPSVEVIGISQDSVQQHREFKQELDLPFTLLSDSDRKVADLFKVPVHLGTFPAKSSFVIGPDNTIKHVYDWLFRPRRHVAKILDSLSNITDGGRFS
ncbi:MAG: peroxiredoxin [Candidatus Thalassarchaeaceae archaeon]|tara:strand:+ start:3537 stop:4013 length:477 start_codon:yes stop_codon:yes gene_type:complete